MRSMKQKQDDEVIANLAAFLWVSIVCGIPFAISIYLDSVL